MSKERVVLLSHYDLDGAGCSVLADHVWHVIYRNHQGYAKIRMKLDELVRDYSDSVDTLVIADLCIEPKDLEHALENFKNVIFYDHHESSEQFVEWTDKYPNLEVHFSLDLCSTALLWIDGVKNRGAYRTRELDAFMNTVNAYDLWKKENSRFQEGVMLNDMFWELHLWDFKKRFANGLAGFTQEELDKAKQRELHRKEVIEDATIETLPSGSKVVVIGDSSVINFVSSLLDGDLFYIISPDFSMQNVSVRVKDSDERFNVNDGISWLPEEYPEMVQSAGGHQFAGGITFESTVSSMNQMVDLLFEADERIRSNNNA